jgi:hypothetical protein
MRGARKLAYAGYWSRTVAIDVLLCFNFVLVFSLMYYRATNLAT